MATTSKGFEVETVAHSVNELERLIVKGDATIVLDLPRTESITAALWEELVERGRRSNAIVKMARPMPVDQCMKCGAPMRIGKAMLDPVSDTFADEVPAPAKLVDCMKCHECGYSETLPSAH
ncbi:hypothetical protein WS50_19025 [Burkholderia territorii]|uniref:hypothetical protein n=1 Tax=Burkholderia territorii TaxID=1503055 RepID=UPI000756B3FD|nr:hypothetical protein [Burkholderia territorii]KUZ02899.1 hypothetical protein WS47_30805 [Burkholderia territorii]KUZ11791.1 hypothetical protein WS50_19025 [Burkholderia territorii]